MPYTDSSKGALLYCAYNIAATLGFIILLAALPVLLLLGERFRAGLAERLGFYPRVVREHLRSSRPIWIHAASVGEALSAIPLVRALQRQFPDAKLIVSTFSYTGRRLGEKVLPVDAVIFLPIDLSWVVRRALRAFEPSMIIVLETEIWPNLLRAAARRQIPVLLLSGRLSVRALRNYLRLRFFFHSVMGYFTALGMQSVEDARRIAVLGADGAKITVTGSLKLAQFEGVAGEAAKAGPQKAPGDLVWVVGSTHRGEEELALEAFAALKRRFDRLRMVLAPRHPERFAEVESLLVARGIQFEKRSQSGAAARMRKDVLLVDSLGDLLEYYAIADIAFVGGSLVDAGGHNILEPARCRVPVLFGPHMANFEAVACEMKTSGGGVEVCGIDELIHEAAALLGDGERRRQMGERAHQVARQGVDVLERSMRLITESLRVEGGNAAPGAPGAS